MTTSLKIILLVAAAALLAGCPCLPGQTACRYECGTTAQCPTGKVCVHEHAHGGNLDTCEDPCTHSDAGVPSYQCPDSPAGSACTTDDGGVFCAPL
jgi:hypothetical protein